MLAFRLGLGSKLVNDRTNNNQNAENLQKRCLVVVEYDAQDDCEDFAEGYDEWDDMLLELFYHVINYQLAQHAQS